MIEFKKSNPYDFLIVCKNSVDITVNLLTDSEILKKAMELISSGVAFTGFLKGEVLFVAGIRLKGNKGQIWSVFSKNCIKHKLSVFRSLKKMLNGVIDEFGIKKIQSESRKGFEQSQRLLEHLGFVKQRRDLNKDYYFYLKVI